jgi:hypothetical protein
MVCSVSSLDIIDVKSVTVSAYVSPVNKNLEILWYQQFCWYKVPKKRKLLNCQYLKIVAQHVEVWSQGAPQDLAETNHMNLLLLDIHLDDRYVQTLH